VHFLNLSFSAIFGFVWFYFSQSVFGKALLFRREVAIGPTRVMWLEQNADFVILTAPLWQCSECIYVFCVNGFWFNSHLGAFHFGSSLIVALVKGPLFYFPHMFPNLCVQI